MGCWVKHFSDNTSESGYDQDILNNKASWSKGRLEDLSEVFISEDKIAITLSVSNTEWHHFDRYAIDLGNPTSSKRKARYIQAKITNEHSGLYLCYNNMDVNLVWATLKKSPHKDNLYYKIQPKDIGKWITACIKNNTPTILLSPSKGSRHGEQLFK